MHRAAKQGTMHSVRQLRTSLALVMFSQNVLLFFQNQLGFYQFSVGITIHIFSFLFLLSLYLFLGASQVALMVKNPPGNVGDIRDGGQIPESERSPGGGRGNSLQYSCLENPLDKGAWWAIVHGVTKSRTRLKQLSRIYIV